jgi:hypothetical protein
MPPAVRYTWMFRTAALVFVLLGASVLWRFGLTDYLPQYRPYGLAFGAVILVVGVFLFRRARFAVAASACASSILCICATVAAPNAQGPVILFFAGLALICGAYAVLAARTLVRPTGPGDR